jgi:ribosomal 50S subunit-recycling heat shock protein
MKMRLDRWLTTLGVCSRSEGKDLIRKGRVTVNGTPVTDAGRTVETESDRLTVGGQEVDGRTVRHSDVADEVHRGVGAGVIEHLEALEGDALLGLARGEGDAVVLACPGGKSATEQYNRYRGMNEQRGRPMP